MCRLQVPSLLLLCYPPQDPDSIVMTIDMHLTLPTGFIKAIRQVSSNCVTGTVQVV